MKSRNSIVGALAVALASLVAIAGCGSGGSSGSSHSSSNGAGTTTTASTAATQFSLTDAPSQDLSVLQIELLTISVVDSSGTSTQVFPATGGSSITVNLLQLHGVSQLLSAFQLPAGTYDSAVITYQNATAADKSGNTLTVTPTSGSATSTFTPPLVVGSSSQFVQLDFNVDASVTNLVTGAGGSLTLNPTVVAGVVHSGTCGMHGLHGTITAITATSITISLPQGSVVVNVSATTVVAAGSTQVQGSTSPLAVGMQVSVAGAFDPTVNAVVATEIDEDTFSQGHGGFGGADLEGLVTSVGASSIDVLVLGSATTGVAPGSTQTITISASTTLAWGGFQGATAPALTDVAIGQDVAIVGVPAATAVLLGVTHLEGTVATIDATAGTATLTVTTDELVDVTGITGFTNPVTLGFSGGLPTGVTVGATIDVAGQFNVTTAGVFTVWNPQAAFQNGAGPPGWHGHHSGQGSQGGGQGGQGGFGQGGQFGPGNQGGQGTQGGFGGGFAVNQPSPQDGVSGSTFTLVSTSPFSITITGDAGPIGNPVTITVVLSSSAQLVERQSSVHGVTAVAASDVAAGITAGRYGNMAAIGTYDATTQTLTADFVIANVK